MKIQFNPNGKLACAPSFEFDVPQGTTPDGLMKAFAAAWADDHRKSVERMIEDIKRINDWPDD